MPPHNSEDYKISAVQYYKEQIPMQRSEYAFRHSWSTQKSSDYSLLT